MVHPSTQPRVPTPAVLAALLIVQLPAVQVYTWRGLRVR